MHDVPFVDAHVHFWDLDTIQHPWLMPPFSSDGLMGSVEAIASNYGPQEYNRDAAAWTIAGTVHVDAGAAADQSPTFLFTVGVPPPGVRSKE